jgi:hypothetical protein
VVVKVLDGGILKIKDSFVEAKNKSYIYNIIKNNMTKLKVLQELVDIKISKCQPRPKYGVEEYQSKKDNDIIKKLQSIYNDEDALIKYFTKL